MEKKKYNEKYAKTKLRLFLLMSLFIFYVYTRTMPMGDVHYKEYTFHFFNILLSFIIMISIVTLEFQDYTKRDWVLAGLLGILSIGTTTPIRLTGIINGTCVFFTFLSSKTLYGEYDTRMELFTARNVREFLEDLKWILIVSGPFILVKLISIYNTGAPIQLYLYPDMLFRALGAGVSEEVIFRLFMFAVIVRVSKGNVESKFLAILIMVFPFALVHFIEVGIYQGMLQVVIGVMNLSIVSIAITILALKRNVFAAMGVHFLIDLILAMFV